MSFSNELVPSRKERLSLDRIDPQTASRSLTARPWLVDALGVQQRYVERGEAQRQKEAPNVLFVDTRITLDPELLGAVSGVEHYEERMLHLVRLLQQDSLPNTTMYFVVSAKPDDALIAYYIDLFAHDQDEADSIRSRVHFLIQPAELYKQAEAKKQGVDVRDLRVSSEVRDVVEGRQGMVSEEVRSAQECIANAQQGDGEVGVIGYNIAGSVDVAVPLEKRTGAFAFGFSELGFKAAGKRSTKDIVAQPVLEELNGSAPENVEFAYIPGLKENFARWEEESSGVESRKRQALVKRALHLLERNDVHSPTELWAGLYLYFTRYQEAKARRDVAMTSEETRSASRRLREYQKVMIRLNEGASGLGNLKINFGKDFEIWERFFGDVEKLLVEIDSSDAPVRINALQEDFLEYTLPIFIEDSVPPQAGLDDEVRREAATSIQRTFMKLLPVQGADIETFVPGEANSPSVQLMITDEEVCVMSVHDQILQGSEYIGAELAHTYKSTITMAKALGKQLQKLGVRGRTGFDFLVSEHGGKSYIYVVEQNARETGTMHMTGFAEAVTELQYDPETQWLTNGDHTAFATYVGNDNVIGLQGKRPEEVIAWFSDNGFLYEEDERGNGLGVVLYNLGMTEKKGKFGMVCIAKGHEEDETSLKNRIKSLNNQIESALAETR